MIEMHNRRKQKRSIVKVIKNYKTHEQSSFKLVDAVSMAASSVAQASKIIMSYQAGNQNNSDTLIANHTVGMRIQYCTKVHKVGTAVYVETANSYYMLIASVKWRAAALLFPVISPQWWTNGLLSKLKQTRWWQHSIIGASQLLSVPHALRKECRNS